jgi:1-phosphatidylinositol-5-phosphate 4-kinase
MYRLTVNNAETYWIVMRNVFSHQLKMHVKFDLKGSTVDRAASEKEKAKQSPTYKDNDFIQMDKKIYIGDEAKATFMSTLEADVKLLQELNLMDYSLLIGIHDCTAPMVDSEDDYTDDEIDNSGDELREDSPTTPVSGEETQPQFEALTDTVTTTTTSPPDEANNVDEVDQVVTKETGGATAVESDVSVVDKGAVVTFAPLPYKPILVAGNDDEIEKYLAEGYYPVINKEVDIFALIGLPGMLLS